MDIKKVGDLRFAFYWAYKTSYFNTYLYFLFI